MLFTNFMNFRSVLKKILGFRKPPAISGALWKFFKERDIKILDVGARGGPLEGFKILAPFSHLFLCEPDSREAERLLQEPTLKKEWRDFTVMPMALGENSGKGILNITHYPGLSSIFEPDHSVIKQFFPSISPFRKESCEAWEVASREEVPVMSLDEASEKYGCRDLTVLKLDTQGSELSILRSGKKVVSSTLVVMTEAEFLPFYKNQPLFSSVHGFLSERGFRLLDIKRTFLRRAYPVPRPVFSKRELAYAHAFYVREKNNDGSELFRDAKIKLICFAIAFWYFDYALKLLRDKEMARFLADSGFAGLEKEIVCYADAVWKSIKFVLPKKEREKYLNFAFQDKVREL